MKWSIRRGEIYEIREQLDGGAAWARVQSYGRPLFLGDVFDETLLISSSWTECDD